PAIAEAAVYGVPDPVAGDQVMACIVVRAGASLTPAELGAFLAAQGDIGGKQHPRFVRIAGAMPRTATFKVLIRVLAADRWNTSDPVWWRPGGRSRGYVTLDRDEAAALDAGIRAGRGLVRCRRTVRQKSAGQHLPRQDGQVAHPDPDGVVHRGGDGRVHPGGAELADPPRPDQARRLVVLVGERDVDVGRDIGVDRYRHVGQVLGQPPSVHRLLIALLHGGLAPAPDDAAGHLRAGGDRVDDPASRIDADRAAQPQQPEVGVDANLGEDHAPGPDRVRRARAVLVELAAPRQFEGPLADQLVDPGAVERVQGVAA